MIVIRLSKERKVNKFVLRFQKNLKRGLALGDVAYSSTSVYIMVPDEALSVAFAYAAFKKAKEEGCSADFAYATPVDPEKVLPEEVRKAGLTLTEGKGLGSKRRAEIVNSLKNKFITSSVLEVILG